MSDKFIPDFLQIPSQVFTNKSLTPVDMFVYGLIYFYSRLKGERCFASNGAFADILGIGTQKVSEAISKLAEQGLVEVIYEDPAKRIRKEIIPLVFYQIRGTGVTPSGVRGYAKRRNGVTPSGVQIKNKDNKELNYAPEGAFVPKADAFFGKKNSDDAVPMDFRAFVLMCRAATFRHVRILAEHADDKELRYTTRGQWREFGNRNLRAAKQLAPYTDKQISAAVMRMEKDTKERNGFISKWGLETIIKYLDEA
jgi:hypothetical protein